MAKAYASTIVDAAVDAVWQIVGDFNGIDKWSARIVSSRLEGGDGRGAVGSIRMLTREDGSVIAERLLAYDDIERSLSYEFADSPPFAVRTYRGSMSVAPVTDREATFVEWFCEFETDAAEEEAMRHQLEQIFSGGLGGLRDVCAGQQR